ncbi:MAG: Guanylate kinase [Parcubacteria group bacterium GW2011_GWC2_39_14]|nr:MAG: Guanylate kinase [Parcubacteria group bacterium GW2011_GWC2_39_14]KKR54736.1 MAG: Guanylate kinase [Parcubacteria group bacterium GW2011_GWA2_40_23]
MKHLIVIAGPTGCGESSVTRGILERLKNSERFITTTSRTPRGSEKNGVDYNFISQDDFKKKIAENYFLEYSYIKNRDDYYGTPKHQIDQKIKENKILIFNYDLVGAKAIKENYPGETLSIFIVPESLDQIRKQLLARNPKMPLEDLAKRLKNAEEELKDQTEYEHILVNKYQRLGETIKNCYQLIKQSLG